MDSSDSSAHLIGKQHILLDEADSTNNEATRMIEANGLSEGTLISARFQTIGRGQRGTNWQSKRGLNFTGTYVLKPGSRGIRGTFDLNKAVALAVRKTVEDFVRKQVWVKWPNDIYTEDGKLAGILIENRLTGKEWEYALVGIGLNVNQMDFDLTSATSIRLMTGNPVAIDEMIRSLNENMEQYYFMLSDSGPLRIREEYHQNMLGMGQMRTFKDARSNLQFQAEVKGTDENGRLLLRTEDGFERSYDVKSVIWL